MEENDLTTVEEPQVNVEEQTTEEVVPSEEQVPAETDTNGSEYEAAYNDVWDKDINDVDLNEEVLTTNVENPLQVDETTDTSTNGTNNSIGAFMSDKPVLKYKGKDVPIDTADELLALAQKGFSYETEMANIKPKKKLLNIVGDIPLETLQAVADLHSGNKSAINYLKTQYGIVDAKPTEDDFWDSNDSSSKVEEPVDNYKPAVATDDPIMDYWSEYTANNQVGAAKVNEIYSGLDESFKAEIYNPDVFPAFVASVESGEFDSVYPVAVKEKTLNPAMSWIQAYQMAVSKTGGNDTPSTPPAAATPPKSVENSRHISGDSAADRVWNDPDYFAQLEAKIFS